MNRSPSPSRITVMRVGNGIFRGRGPKRMSGPSTTQRPGATALRVFSGSYVSRLKVQLRQSNSGIAAGTAEARPTADSDPLDRGAGHRLRLSAIEDLRVDLQVRQSLLGDHERLRDAR